MCARVRVFVPEETNVYVEKYYALIRKDIEAITEILSGEMPQQLRGGLEGELKRLQMLNAALEGDLDKSTLHQLRANLRWARQKLGVEREPVKRRKIESELSLIEQNIKYEVERKDRK